MSGGLEIDSAFSYDHFGLLALTPSMPSEQRESPQGTYYVYDGVHRSIVLAKKLLSNEVEYRPVSALYLTPRRK